MLYYRYWGMEPGTKVEDDHTSYFLINRHENYVIETGFEFLSPGYAVRLAHNVLFAEI